MSDSKRDPDDQREALTDRCDARCCGSGHRPLETLDARDGGRDPVAEVLSVDSLLQQVKGNHDFDAFILGYGRLRLDPDYVRNLFHSKNDKSRGWNMSGYRNAEFDQISEQSTTEMDTQKRRHLVLRMQELIARDLPYIPLYKPSVVEAVRADRFAGWVEMLEGIGNIWSMCHVKPVER